MLRDDEPLDTIADGLDQRTRLSRVGLYVQFMVNTMLRPRVKNHEYLDHSDVETD